MRLSLSNLLLLTLGLQITANALPHGILALRDTDVERQSHYAALLPRGGGIRPRPGHGKPDGPPTGGPDPLDPNAAGPLPPHIGDPDLPSDTGPDDPLPPHIADQDIPPDTSPDDLAPAHAGGDSAIDIDAPPDSTRRPIEEIRARLEQAGKKANTRLNSAISDGLPDINRATFAELEQRFTLPGQTPDIQNGNLIKAGDGEDPGITLASVLSKLDPPIDPDKEFTQYTWKNNKNLPDDENQISQSIYSPDTNSIMILNSYRDRDIFPPTEKFTSSEITFQTWAEVANGEQDQLKYIVRHDVRNGDSLTVAELPDFLGSDKTAVKTVSVLPNNPNWNALLGTDNVKGMVHMLADHHNALGNKKITEIKLIREWANDKYALVHFIIVLG